jgi:ribosome production factor 2
MSLLREVKPRNARTARIVKAREPQVLEDRKRTLLLHGTKCPLSIRSVLTTIHSLTKPHSTHLNKKNENIHPFEDPSSLEFLAGKNDCGLVVFGSSSKKRPNSITILRVYNGKTLDMVEILLLPQLDAESYSKKKQLFQVGVEMKPLILFAGSQWADTSSSESAAIYQTLKSLLLDVFCGEEISSIDVAGMQYMLLIAAPDTPSTIRPLPGSEDPKPVIQLRWYKILTRKSGTKLPRVELQPEGPAFDFRVSRYKEADATEMKDALRKGRDPNTARTKKNVETDFVGDKLGRVHLGKQDLSELQTRKMKGLKRLRDEDEEDENTYPPGMDEQDDIDLEDGGMELDGSEEGSDVDELLEQDADIFDNDDEDVENELPKRQKLS